MLPLSLSREKNLYYLNVKVFPNSNRQVLSKETVTYKDRSYFKLHINSSPTDGKANKEIVEFLSKFFDIKKNCLTISSGQFGKHKVIQIKTIDDANFNKVGDIISSLMEGVHNVKNQ